MMNINFAELMGMYFGQHPNLTNPIGTYSKISIPHHFIATQFELSFYTNQLRIIYDRIFVLQTQTQQNQKAIIKIDDVLPFPPHETPMPVCNKILKKNQVVFKCYDCITHDSAVLCKSCFQDADHKGHRYIQLTSGGGNCDCGNPDAIKTNGFCVNHPGKADPVEISPKESEHFNLIIGTIFQWIFRLHEKERSKSADILGQLIADFLIKRNQKSLYYNTLTHQLIFNNRNHAADKEKSEQKVIQKIFHYGVKLLNFAKKMTNVFFNMFSLEELKYNLTVNYVLAFNKIAGFENSNFRSLYIQLFANNEVVDKVLDDTKQVLYPDDALYTQEFENIYLDNLTFLGSIKQEVAQKFFVLLNKKGFVRFSWMEEIQKKVEKGPNHIITFINKDLNRENHYYQLLGTIISLIKNNPQSLKDILNNFVNVIMGNKYSYKKNKVVMPFHKVLAMILTAIYNANFEEITGPKIQHLLDHKFKAKDIFTKIFKLILSCWKEFARTFYETSYFDNYNLLYVKMGNTIFVYDLLMFSICTDLLMKEIDEEKLNEILFSVLSVKSIPEQKSSKENQMIDEHSEDSKMIEELPFEPQEWSDLDEGEMDEESHPVEDQTPLKKLKKSLELMKIIIESCISERAQIIAANFLKIKDENIKYRTQKIFVEAMNNFKEISADNLRILTKHFIQSKNIQNEIIKQFLTFDKTKKKYILNQMKDQKFSQQKIPFFLYPSLKKIGGILAEDVKEPIETLMQSVNIPPERVRKLKFLFNDKFISKISSHFISELKAPEYFNNKEAINVFIDFLELIKTLQYLMREEAPKAIFKFYETISELALQEQFSFLQEKLARKKSEDLKQKDKASTKMKFEERKRKKLEEIKKKQSSYDALLNTKQQENEKENESACLICRQQKSEGLCLLGSFKYSNTVQSFNEAQGKTLSFDSCFHPIHMNCFMKTSKHQNLPCPLCKAVSNILLPFEKQFNDEKTIFDIFERISTLKVVFAESYEGYDKRFQESGILCIFRSLSSMIGKNLLKGEPILDEKDQRIANILYGMAKTISSSNMNQYHLKQQQIDQFLEISKLKIKQFELKTTNFYAMEYIIVKILYRCFIQNPEICTDVLTEPEASLINKKDLRKIWQMCDQIVSLRSYDFLMQESKVDEMKNAIDMYVPPENVFELLQVRDSFEMNCKNGHQMCICILCQAKCCYDCKQTKKHFRQEHCGEGLSFNVLSGGLVYVWDEKLTRTPSLYGNQLGFEWNPSKSPEGFYLDKQTYEQMKKSILNDKIEKFLMIKFPNLLKNGGILDTNLELP